MKTTIEIPDELLTRAKIAAARDRSTLKQLIIEGLESVLGKEKDSVVVEEAIERLNKGYHLGGKYLNRDAVHER